MGWVTSPSNWGVPYWFRSFSQGLYVPEFKEAHTAYKLILDTRPGKVHPLSGSQTLSSRKSNGQSFTLIYVLQHLEVVTSRILNNQDES